MKIKFTYVKLLPITLFLLTGSNSLFGQILFQSSFEGSNPFAGWSNSQSCCSHSVTASTSIVHDGAKAFRSEVRVNDPSVSSGYRAELTLPNISDQGDMWYGWSMYFEANNAAGTAWTGQYGVTTQWHPQNSSGSAELALYADDGVFDIATNPSGGSGETHQSSGLQNIVANRWYDIVFHVNWASSGGSLQVWIDGQPYFSKTNLNWAQGAYFKMGMNRWLMTNTWVVYYDNVKIGRNVTYNDVAPTTSTPPANQLPTANAGPDKSITLPIDYTTLNGSGTDPDGTISSYAWSKMSGPSNPALGSTGPIALTGLVQGSYQFRLIVTDNDGAKDTDYVNVTVNPPAANQPPTANAGPDRTITLPIDYTTLSGSGTDPDGTISSYAWSKMSGPSNPALGSTGPISLTGLVQGSYQFRLIVTDNGGAKDTDYVNVTVNPPAANQPPTANAGPDRTIILPINYTTLSGSGTDVDGTIVSYIWSQISGPSNPTLGNTGPLSLTGLVLGSYQFRLVVTDDDGATDADTVRVTVNAVPNQPPVARITADTIWLTIPVNSTPLNGSTSTDADGIIASYEWTQLSGPTQAMIGNGFTAQAQVSGLTIGTYTFRLRVTDDDGASSTKTVVVLVSNTNGQGRYFNIYPNPTRGSLTFEYSEHGNGKIRVSVYDATRRLLKDGFMDKNQVTLKETIDLNHLESGMYIIQIVLPDGKTIAKHFAKM